MKAVSSPILFFDGDCNLCNATVRFVLKHERSAEFQFASLQSAPARAVLVPLGIDAADLSSVLVLDDGALLRESDAAIRILSALRNPWRLLALIKLLPRAVRNRAYRFVGLRRYRWWGRVEGSCPLPTPEVRERFLTIPK